MPASSSASAVSPSTPIVWPGLVAAAALIGLLVAFPPFRIVSRHATTKSAPVADAPAAFDAVAFARRFWTDRLLPAAGRPPAAAPMLAALRQDPAAAARAYAHRVGLGHAAYYFVRGTGRVTAVERSRLLLDVDGAIVALRTGPVFGNVIRDGCGLLDVNRVPGLAEFNALSAELNRLVESRVQPPLKKNVPVGATLHFAACAEAPESLPSTAGAPLLTFVPIEVEVSP